MPGRHAEPSIVSAGDRDEARRPSLTGPIALALLAWGALAAGLMLAPRWRGEAAPTAGAMLPRLLDLLGESTLFFVGPLVLAVVLALAGSFAGAGRRPPPAGRAGAGYALRAGLRFGTLGLAASAVLWIGLAGWALLDDVDPWERLPGGRPAYLAEFLARHPGLAVTTFGGSDEVRLHGARGEGAYVHGPDLAGASVRFEPCTANDGDAASMGGIAPYPGARCGAVLRMRRGDVERAIHVFSVGEHSDHERVRRHFEQWAASAGAEGSFTGGPNHYFFRASRADAHWDLRLFAGRRSTIEIYVPRGGRTQDWPGQAPGAR